MKKDKVENKNVSSSACEHKYFNMIDGVLYCSECGKPAEEVKAEKK